MAKTMTTQTIQPPSVSLPLNRHGRPGKHAYQYKAVKGTERVDSILASTYGEKQAISMPISTGSPLQTTFPSFMSVFGNSPSAEPNTTAGRLANSSPNTDRRAYISNYETSIRRDSTSTFESNESSPTTTVSTVASSLTEPSPNSSPESPHLNSKLPAAFPRRGSTQSQAAMDRREQFSNSFPILPGVERSDSPQKKMRNMKNLSVNTSASNRPATSHLPRLGMSSTNTSPPQQASSAPPTPAFIVPPKAPRRKPSNLGLSITTPETSASNPQENSAPIPQTPLEPQIKSLRRLQTSTDGTLQSPMAAPEGGMRFPPFNAAAIQSHFSKAGPPLSISPISVSSPIKKQTLEHVKEEPDYEVPLSQEVKSPAYPEGPVCIYDPYVYLYLEPTMVEASEFDVVLNVAREVLNPFKEVRKEPGNRMVDQGVQVKIETADKGVQCSFDDIVKDSITQPSAVEPQTAGSEIYFRSAFEAQPGQKDTSPPSTPKAISPKPEYIHIPWDHNTNVVDDLLRLCSLIDERVRQRKKVLVHCQCGVSRSASLVVAFGMYRNPRLSVQEAYDAVKNRSRWIGPNMNLIYQLSEFKSKLATTGLLPDQSWQSWRGIRSSQADSRGPAAGMAITSSNRKRSLTSTDATSQPDRLSTSLPALSIRPLSSAQLRPPLPLVGLSPGPLTAPANYQPSAQALVDQKTDHADSDNLSTISTTFPQVLERLGIPEPIFSPTVEAPQVTPLGAIAVDLQQVALDLGPREKSIKGNNSRELPNSEPDSATTAPPGSWPNGETESPKIVSKTSLSNLKMGFTRLFSKREPVPALPLRPNAPRFEKEGDKSAFKRSFVDDVPPTPSLLSPRAAEFTASPFHRTLAGDLAGSSTYEQGLMSPQAVEDPRSPHQKGEAPITRSIFDVI